MGGGLSLSFKPPSSENQLVLQPPDQPVDKEDDTVVRDGSELDDDDFNDFTVMDEFDDASAGTDQRVIRILNLSQHEKNIELLTACSHGDDSEVAILLKYGADPKRLDWDPCSTPFQLAKDGKDRWSPLHAAAREGHRKICQMLIKADSPIDFQNGWLRSPLHYAAEHGRRNIVLLLLHHGANVNLADWQKYTPLHYAISRGHRACVKVLLEAGADVNAKTLGYFSPLHLAAKRGRDDTTSMLLDFGAKVNAKAKASTPLHEACKACNASVVRILIDNGADVEAINANRKTPMMIAVLNRDQMTESLLLEAGAFAGHLQPMKPPEEWPELKDENEEYENSLSGVSSPTSGIGKDNKKAAPRLSNKFKSASLKVIKMM